MPGSWKKDLEFSLQCSFLHFYLKHGVGWFLFENGRRCYGKDLSEAAVLARAFFSESGQKGSL